MPKKSLSFDPSNFRKLFSQMLSAQQMGGLMRQHGNRHGGKPKLGVFEVLMSLVYHLMQREGTFAAHVGELHGVDISDSALSKRRSRLPWKIFERILEMALQLRADRKKHPRAFYKGFRLIGIDGTTFSVFNTPAVVKGMKKWASRRFEAAFAKLRVCSLVELGIHNPLAVAIGKDRESELTLAYRLMDRIPKQSLLIADRLFTAGLFLMELLKHCIEVKSDFLIRIPSNFKVQKIQKLADGSILVEIRGRAHKPQAKEVQFMAREIRGIVRTREGTRKKIRLWTSLLEYTDYPALELLKLYAQRWEQELSFKELKVDLRRGDLLASYTPETAMQEIAALFIAQAVVARVRLQTADVPEQEVLQVSFAKVLDHIQSLWKVFSWGIDTLSRQQQKVFVDGMIHSLINQTTAPRRPRSCPRAIRQPLKSWPRLIRNSSSIGDFHYEVT